MPHAAWDEIARQAGTDKASTGHDYLRHYWPMLHDCKITRVLEIGVASGASLRMWHGIFPSARITGVDVNPACAEEADPESRIEVRIGDAGSHEQMRWAGRRRFDLIVDDGSHRLGDTCRNLGVFAAHLADDGLYVIEDVCLDASVGHVHHLDGVLHCLDTCGLAVVDIKPSASGAAQAGDLVIVFAERGD